MGLSVLVNDGPVTDQNLTYRTQDGATIPMSFSASPVQNHLGVVIGVVTVARDMRETKRLIAAAAATAASREKADILASLNEDLEEARNAADASNRTKSEFLSNMSHELRTPLHGILGFARRGIKKARADSSPGATACFEHIQNSGQTLLYLVNNILDLAKLEAGSELALAKTNATELLESTIAEFETLTSEKNLDLAVHKPEADIYARLDSQLFKQVVRNLVSNAIKFSPTDVTMEVRLEVADAMLLLRVSDRGIGIPPDELKAIFDKFIQSSKTNSGAGGTGLGLAICRGIVEAHRGTIYAEGRDGRGATFVAAFPLAGPAESETDGRDRETNSGD